MLTATIQNSTHRINKTAENSKPPEPFQKQKNYRLITPNILDFIIINIYFFIKTKQNKRILLGQ